MTSKSITEEAQSTELPQEWVEQELAAQAFPCGICGVSFGNHSLKMLRECFQQITRTDSNLLPANQSAREQAEKIRKDGWLPQHGAAQTNAVNAIAAVIAAAQQSAFNAGLEKAIAIVEQLLPEKYNELRVVLQYGVMDEIRRDLIAALEAARGTPPQYNQQWVKKRWEVVSINPRYEVSDTGLVRRRSDRAFLGQWLNDQGYPYVRLSRPRSMQRVHRLVATAFVDNPKNLPDVNHLDCDRANNNYTNLEWCTQQENLNHAARLGRIWQKGKRTPAPPEQPKEQK